MAKNVAEPQVLAEEPRVYSDRAKSCEEITSGKRWNTSCVDQDVFMSNVAWIERQPEGNYTMGGRYLKIDWHTNLFSPWCTGLNMV